MIVEAYKSLWGMSGTYDEKLDKIKSQGYDGYEDGVQDHFKVRAAIERTGLKYIGMLYVDNFETFKRGIDEAFDCGATAVTVHAGKPWLSYQQGLDFLGKCTEAAKLVPFPVNFETHRGRLLYEPMSTVQYLKDLPDLYLCGDYSHWTCVTGSMLDGFKDQMELVYQRTRHVHARVGFEEGPQVPDARSPRWETHLMRFETFWDRVFEVRKADGLPFTFDPEFGPPNYQWTDPNTGKPLSDIEEVALWLADRLRKRYQNR